MSPENVPAVRGGKGATPSRQGHPGMAIIPLPRMPVITMIIIFLGSGIPINNLHLPLLLGGGTTQFIPKIYTKNDGLENVSPFKYGYFEYLP